MVLFYRISGSLASLSLTGSIFVILSYFSMKELRKHPTNMVFFLSICDCFFSLKFIVTAVYPGSDQLEQHAVSCYLQAGWAQFWGLASVAWNGMISLNLLINLSSQGFARTSTYSKLYHMFVWILALSSTSLMYAFPHRIGPSGDGTCWIMSNSDPLRLLFFIPLLTFFMLAIMAVIMASMRTNQAAGLNDKTRRGVLARMVLFSSVFILCWSGPLVHRIHSLVTHPSESVDSMSLLSYFDAIGICTQGFANALVWLTNPAFFSSFRRLIGKFSFLKCLSSEESSPLLTSLQDSGHDINKLDTVLRRNIITCILMGIHSSLREPSYSPDVTQQSYTETNRYDNEKLFRSQPEIAKTVNYEFIDYAPVVFSSLRALSGISSQDYVESMKPTNFLGTITDQQLAKFSEGRSNSFFIFSPNKRFILKTITEGEARLLLRILPNYFQYLLANRNSLLTRFFGCHGLRGPMGEIIYVVIMGNVFCTNLKIHETYDLKGSWVNRSSAERKKSADKSKLGMDNDLDRKLHLEPHRREEFIEQISHDALFLASLNIMDYSVLLGFHSLEEGGYNGQNRGVELQAMNASTVPSLLSIWQETQHLPNGHLSIHMSRFQNEIYFTGVIDILQLYDANKKMERFFKVYLLGKDKKGLSSMPPADYAKRFIHSISNVID